MPSRAGMAFRRVPQTVRRVGPFTWPPLNFPGSGSGSPWPVGRGLARMIAAIFCAVNPPKTVHRSPLKGDRVKKKPPKFCGEFLCRLNNLGDYRGRIISSLSGYQTGRIKPLPAASGVRLSCFCGPCQPRRESAEAARRKYPRRAFSCAGIGPGAFSVAQGRGAGRAAAISRRMTGGHIPPPRPPAEAARHPGGGSGGIPGGGPEIMQATAAALHDCRAEGFYARGIRLIARIYTAPYNPPQPMQAAFLHPAKASGKAGQQGEPCHHAHRDSAQAQPHQRESQQAPRASRSAKRQQRTHHQHSAKQRHQRTPARAARIFPRTMRSLGHGQANHARTREIQPRTRVGSSGAA